MNPLIYREGGNQPEHFCIGGTQPDIFFGCGSIFVNIDACSVRNLLKYGCSTTFFVHLDAGSVRNLLNFSV